MWAWDCEHNSLWRLFRKKGNREPLLGDASKRQAQLRYPKIVSERNIKKHKETMWWLKNIWKVQACATAEVKCNLWSSFSDSVGVLNLIGVVQPWPSWGAALCKACRGHGTSAGIPRNNPEALPKPSNAFFMGFSMFFIIGNILEHGPFPGLEKQQRCQRWDLLTEVPSPLLSFVNLEDGRNSTMQWTSDDSDFTTEEQHSLAKLVSTATERSWNGH